jgi:hypothetical protein
MLDNQRAPKAPINLLNVDNPEGTPLPKNGKAYSTGELPVYIISAHLEALSDSQNRDVTAELFDKLFTAFGGPSIKQVRGSYKGVEEASYVVNGDKDTILELAAYFGQESILHLDSSRNATLIFIDNRPQEKLGRLVNCTEEEAKAGDAWTWDKSQDEYYRVV